MNISNSLEAKITAAIQSVVGTSPTALHEPNFDGNESVYLQQCLEFISVLAVLV